MSEGQCLWDILDVLVVSNWFVCLNAPKKGIGWSGPWQVDTLNNFNSYVDLSMICYTSRRMEIMSLGDK